MSKIVRFFRYTNTLSLDVALGAVVSASFLSTISKIKLTTSELTCLGLVVWAIYTADHLLDANRISFDATTHRHRFHQKYFTQLFVAVLLTFAVATLLLPLVRKPVILWGGALMIIVVVYFFYQYKLGALKELVGTILYTGGVFLPSGALLPSVPSFQVIIFMLSFAITVWINLVLFSWIGYKQDKANNYSSLTLVFGHKKTRIVLSVLFALQLMLGFYYMANYFSLSVNIIILFLMNGGLFIIFFNPGWFIRHDRYRIVGDAIFLLPLICLVVQ